MISLSRDGDIICIILGKKNNNLDYISAICVKFYAFGRVQIKFKRRNFPIEEAREKGGKKNRDSTTRASHKTLDLDRKYLWGHSYVLFSTEYFFKGHR